MTVVDGVFAAVGAGDFRLGLARYRADHREAQQLGPLRNDQSDAARGGMKQDGVAGLEVVNAPHQIRRGQAAHGHSGCRLAADAFGQLDQRRGGTQALGAVGAQRVDEARVGDTIADRDVRHALADRFDHAGCLDTHAGRQRNRI